MSASDPEIIQPDDAAPNAAPDPAVPVPRIYFWQSPLFLLLACLICGFVLTSLVLPFISDSAATSTTNDLELPEPTAAPLKAELLTLKPSELKPQDEILLKIWRTSNNDEKFKLYQQLHDKYPQTPHYKSISKQFTIMQAHHKKLIEQEAKRLKEQEVSHKREHETNALKAYTHALSIYDPAQKRTALQKITTDFSGTKAAGKAKKMIASIDQTLRKAQEAKLATENARAAIKKEEEKRKLEEKIRHPREVFLNRYNLALQKWDLQTAKKLATSLAKSQKVPELKDFAESCISDVEDLQKLQNTLKNYFTSQLGKEIKIKIGKGSRMNGKLIKVTDRTLRIMVGGRYPQTIEYPKKLNYETVLEIYKNAASLDGTSAEVMGGLFLHCLGENQKALDFFKKAGDQNPRREHHQIIMRSRF